MADLPPTAPAGSLTARRRPAGPAIWAGIALALLATIAGVLIATRETPRRAPVASSIHLLIDPPAGTAFADNLPNLSSGVDTIALSPDGTKLAATVVDAERFRKLWVRPLSSLSGEILLDTDGATRPFWSPDSKSIGYFAHQKLRIIPASGGPSRPIATSLNYGGGTWNADGTILVGDSSELFSRVSASGGAPSAEGPPELKVVFPWFLPDGRRFLFVAVRRNGVFLGGLGSPNPYLLISDGQQPAFASPDSLLFLRAGQVMVQKLDLRTGRVVGEPAIVADGGTAGRSSIAAFSVSETGVLVYRFGALVLNQLVWYSRDGRPLGPAGAPARYQQVFLSPDETLAAVDVSRDGPQSLVRIYPDAWSPDGKWIIYRREGRAVYIVPPDGRTKPQLLLDSPYAMDQFQFSPDTQWLAYNSLKSGQWEVYVSRFPSMRDTRQVSTAGGCQPIWRRDGEELFYLTEDGRLMSVPITGSSVLATDKPKELFRTGIRVSCAISQYAATRNGEKFLMIESAHPANVPASREPIHILINWTAALPH